MKLFKKSNLTAKKILLSGSFLTAITIFPGTILQAQEGFGKDMDLTPEQRVESLIERLELSEEQAEEVRLEMQLSQAQAQEILESYGLTREDADLLKKALREVRADFMDTVKSLLTEDQLQEAQRMKKMRRMKKGEEVL